MPLAGGGRGTYVLPLDVDLTSEAVSAGRKLVRYKARGRHHSEAARQQIVEESYTTGARVEDTSET